MVPPVDGSDPDEDIRHDFGLFLDLASNSEFWKDTAEKFKSQLDLTPSEWERIVRTWISTMSPVLDDPRSLKSLEKEAQDFYFKKEYANAISLYDKCFRKVNHARYLRMQV